MVVYSAGVWYEPSRLVVIVSLCGRTGKRAVRVRPLILNCSNPTGVGRVGVLLLFR